MPAPSEGRWVLICLAVGAFGLVVARACLQSVTIDEADAYLIFASHSPLNELLYPSSGNHLLYTLFAHVVTELFGLNELTLRLPAILGAAFYITSAAYLSSVMSNLKLMKAALFICLVYNPFVLDYLVAARGYSMALGFLLAAIAFLTAAMISESQSETALTRKVTSASVCLGLSFAANFSFAFVDAIAMLLFILWLLHRTSNLKATAFCIIPGVLLAACICGWTLWHWPKNQLYFGVTSWKDTWVGIVAASFDRLNPELPHWLRAIDDSSVHQALAGAIVMVTLGVLFTRKPSKLHIPAAYLAGVIVATIAVHSIAFETVHLLLPKDRTALFFPPLLFLTLGAAVGRRRDIFQYCGTAVLILTGAYFLGCLRLSYFKEWRYNADTKQIYWTMDYVAHRQGISKWETEWRYVAALNFYRMTYNDDYMRKFVAAWTPQTNQTAYVLYYPDSEKFIKQQGLKVIYHNFETNAAVAVSSAASLPARMQSGRPMP
jgi:hypothetical protein